MKNPFARPPMKTYRLTITATFDIDYTPGTPGQLSGPPEYCYPPEPSEFEITPEGFETIHEKADEAYAEELELQKEYDE